MPLTPRRRMQRTLAALAGLLATALTLGAGDVDRMVLAGGRVGLDTPAELALAVTPEQLLVRASPPPCREGFDYCLYLPEDAYAGTNLRSAGLAVTRREDLRALTSCLLAQPAGWSDLQPGVTIEESAGPAVATSRFGDVGEGAAGSYTLGEVLRLFDGEECWELETRVGLARPQDPPSAAAPDPTEEARSHAETLLWSVVHSVSLDGRPVLWPDEGMGMLEDFVRVDLPAEATSPLVLRGEARGTWFFEGSFPVRLVAQDGTELATDFVTAQGEWMTEGFVPFEGELEFQVEGPTPAVLVLARDNPSDLPEHDAAARYDLILR